MPVLLLARTQIIQAGHDKAKGQPSIGNKTSPRKQDISSAEQGFSFFQIKDLMLGDAGHT